MTSKNLYDVLGVPRDATFEQLRKAYVLRSKMLHPDRFDQTTQRAEWELANEILKELNHAYGVLRDPKTRGQYDRTVPGETPPQQPPPRPTAKLGRLKSGTAYFDSLPQSTQQRLAGRAAGSNKIQHAIQLAGVGGNYFWAVILAGWFGVLFLMAFGSRWRADTFLWLIGLTGLVALLQAFNINWIVRWYKSHLRCWLFITPIYVIKTHLDRVWYWPIWEISDIRATHRYKNGAYQETDLHMKFGAAREEFTISPESAYEALHSALRAFDQKIQSAKAQGDWVYFFEQDDFREFDPETSPPRPRRAFVRTIAIFGACFLLYGMSFVIAASVNANQVSRPAYTDGTQRSTYTPQPAAPPFNEPELELPPNGEAFSYTEGAAVAPFEIKSSYGSNYLVKLTDASIGQTVITVFVRGGIPVTLNVPLGTYFVKYATGSRWYGYNHLFGPSTSYSKASQTFAFSDNGDQISGYTITLYKVQNGNLRTRPISANEF
jgi:hypothetical protein